MKDTLDYLLGGYHADHRNMRQSCHWWGFRMNLDTRRGRTLLWLLELRWTLSCLPRRGKTWLANQLMRAAMRLRGERVSVFGFYTDCTGNEAARLTESLRMELICALAADEPEKFQEAEETLQQLSSLAQAIYTHP